MPDIAINDVTPRIQYTATGGQTVFPYPFAVFAQNDLKVYLTPAGNEPDDTADLLVLTTEYTVSGVGAEAGGNVTLVTGATLNDTITVERDMPIERSTDFQLAGDFLAATLNDELDRVTMMIQQIETIFERRGLSFARSVDLQGVSLLLPNPVASKVLAMNASRTGLVWADIAALGVVATAFAQTLLDDTNAAAARTTLGAGATGDAIFTAATAAAVRSTLSLYTQAEVNALFAYVNLIGATGRLPFPRNWISGLAYALGTDTAHDIDIAAGEARDATNAHNIILSATLTKQIDAAWAVGTNQGGLDTGAVANSTRYYVWLIKRSDTGVVDALFSASATAPTMPANYDYKRLIGFVKTDGSANLLGFSTMETAGGGLDYVWKATITDVSATEDTTANLRALGGVPLGFKVVANLNVYVDRAAGTTAAVYVSSPDANDEAVSTTVAPLASHLDASDPAAQSAAGAINMRVRTDASAQIRTVASAASTGLVIATLGFEWSRR